MENKERKSLLSQLESEKEMDETAIGERIGEKATTSQQDTTQEPKILDETGVIGKGTKVTGDVITRGHLVVYGEIEGNIEALGNVDITGRVTGDIACNNIKLSNCSSKSNLTARGTVTIDGSARVQGTIVCERITVDGTVEGSINARQEVSVFQNAKIVGDIRAKSLGVESGAELQGNITVVK